MMIWTLVIHCYFHHFGLSGNVKKINVIPGSQRESTRKKRADRAERNTQEFWNYSISLQSLIRIIEKNWNELKIAPLFTHD